MLICMFSIDVNDQMKLKCYNSSASGEFRHFVLVSPPPPNFIITAVVYDRKPTTMLYLLFCVSICLPCPATTPELYYPNC